MLGTVSDNKLNNLDIQNNRGMLKNEEGVINPTKKLRVARSIEL